MTVAGAAGGGGGAVVPGVVSVALLATFSRTIVPCVAVAPGFGFCAMTVPAGWSDGTGTRFTLKPASSSVFVASDEVVPTTSGTVTGLPPLETFSSTTEPFSADVPSAGSVSTTVPSGLSANTSVTFASNPAAWTAATASSLDLPTTLGTATVSGPAEMMRITVFPSSSSVPASGFWLITTSTGFALSSRRDSGSKPASRTSASATS